MLQLRNLSLANNLPARRLLLFLLPILLLTQYIDAHAQSARVPRVGVPTILSPDRPPLKGLRDGLEEAGYVIGTNLLLDITQKKTLSELEETTKAFVKDRFDVLVITSSREALIAQRATREIPVVFAPADYPVEQGLVETYARPERNLTGLARFSDTDDSSKLVELFKELAPNLKSVTVLNEAGRNEKILARQGASIRRVANRLKLQVKEIAVYNINGAFAVVSDLSGVTDHGVLVNCTNLFAFMKELAIRAKERRLPIQGCAAVHVTEDGALFSYAADLYRVGRRGAWYVDRILKGAKPRDLPVETPKKYKLVINLKTAKAVGISIPPEVLQRADKVID